MPRVSAAPHILVIRRRYLGDLVLLGSLLRNLKLHWPACRIGVLCESAYAPLLELNPDVDGRWLLPAARSAWPRFFWDVRRAGFTHVLDLDNRERTALVTRASGAPVRATVRHGEDVHLPWFYTAKERVPAGFLDTGHITDLYLRVLDLISVPVATRDIRLTPPAADVATARTWLQGARLVIHPGSRSAWRVWPPAHYAKVIETLHHELGLHTAIVAGPNEQATVDEIFRNLSVPAHRIEQRLTIPQLAALFAASPALLCHDSGPMHLAAAVGTRVIALFGSQPLNIWRPVGTDHVTLQAPLPCAHCVTPGECVPADSYRNHCVRNITVDRVLSAVRAAIA